jgi:hypothetical protein
LDPNYLQFQNRQQNEGLRKNRIIATSMSTASSPHSLTASLNADHIQAALDNNILDLETQANSSSNLSNSTNPANSSSSLTEEKYQVRPSYHGMFKPAVVESILQQSLTEYLTTREYDPNESATWSKELASSIKNKLKELKLPRYKYLVQVVIGENRGAGVRCGTRQLWDKNTDKQVAFTYRNQSLWCMAVAFGVYLY